MNEAEWLTFDRLSHIWEAQCLWPLLTERKCRLFAVACCRRIWQFIPDEESRQIVESLERVADAGCTEEEWGAARDAYRANEDDEAEYLRSRLPWAEQYALSAVVTCTIDKNNRLADMVAGYCSAVIEADSYLGEKGERRQAETRAQCDLVRDLFGNPFRPVSLDSTWLTPDVLALARGISMERAFDRMPILADALQDAGCDNEDVLSHCRDASATHVRGCWVVDLLLGKE